MDVELARGHLVDGLTELHALDELLDRYADKTGREGIADWPVFLAFSFFRTAAIIQGVYKRGLDGNASSPDAIRRGAKARQLAEAGWRIVETGR